MRSRTGCANVRRHSAASCRFCISINLLICFASMSLLYRNIEICQYNNSKFFRLFLFDKAQKIAFKPNFLVYLHIFRLLITHSFWWYKPCPIIEKGFFGFLDKQATGFFWQEDGSFIRNTL